MAIVLKNSIYHITIDSQMIVGVMGCDYDKFLASLEGNNIFYLDKRVSVSNKKVSSLFSSNMDKAIEIIKDFNLDNTFLDKKINELSHSELKILKYILLIISNKKIIIIDEPFMDLDYQNKKRIILLIKSLIKGRKTVIVGSIDSNIIYSLCKKVLFIKENDYYYDDIKVFSNIKVLDKYNVMMPDIVRFILLAKNKNIKLNYSYDIRDLIKDVYRNVSKK